MGSRKTVTMPRMEKPLYKLRDNRIDCGMRTCENNVIKKWWFKHCSRQIKYLARKDKNKEKIGSGILEFYVLLSESWWNTMLLIIYHVFHQYFFTKWRFLFSMSRKFYYLIVLLTMATKGVIIHPILAAPEHAPKPIPRMLVGYTSGVYT